MFDTSLNFDFLNGVIDNLIFHKLNKEIYVISSGGPNYILTLKLNSKTKYMSTEDLYKTIPNSINMNEPYYFLCLTESKQNMKTKTPQYFLLNQKEKNYIYKLIKTSQCNFEKAHQIGNFTYSNSTDTDPIPVLSLFTSFNKFIGIYVVTKENLKKLKERIEDSVAFNIILLQDDTPDYDKGIKIVKTLDDFIKKNKIIKNFDKLTNKTVILDNETIFKED